MMEYGFTFLNKSELSRPKVMSGQEVKDSSVWGLQSLDSSKIESPTIDTTPKKSELPSAPQQLVSRPIARAAILKDTTTPAEPYELPCKKSKALSRSIRRESFTRTSTQSKMLSPTILLAIALVAILEYTTLYTIVTSKPVNNFLSTEARNLRTRFDGKEMRKLMVNDDDGHNNLEVKLVDEKDHKNASMLSNKEKHSMNSAFLDTTISAAPPQGTQSI